VLVVIRPFSKLARDSPCSSSCSGQLVQGYVLRGAQWYEVCWVQLEQNSNSPGLKGTTSKVA